MRTTEVSTEQLQADLARLRESYRQYKDMGLNLNISRGLPCSEQLDLNAEMFHVLDENNYTAEDGTDCRNYGVMYGLPECIRLFSQLLDIPEEHIILGGESSLNFMYDQILRIYTFGTLGEKPWGQQAQEQKLKWLCPVPGYDCHFNLTEALGFEMINIPLLETGPDMDLIERLVSEDPTIKGIWCVPQYSNPTGVVYSDETVERLAKLKTAANDFRIVWDNAYAVHHLYRKRVVKDILKAASAYGLEDRILYFFSTAKITFPGSGVCLMASGGKTIAETRQQLKLQIFSHDKLNQLRHVKYLKTPERIHEHMEKIAQILRPRFDLVDRLLTENRLYEDLYTWYKPDGGYFITADSYAGCAAEILARVEAAGVKVATAASTFPYHRDPQDTNIRLAPTYPPMEELETAIRLFCICANLVGIEKVLKEREN
ncbi:MAG: aminotransferase class I/II-fold pyridoxal phosphate-dependent enzyme [Eubacteriales bacterium]|nr:aminotransferase class I/II-fold pyridoxal phosphate-dependent enzyme [Eubacteriales bacterium]